MICCLASFSFASGDKEALQVQAKRVPEIRRLICDKCQKKPCGSQGAVTIVLYQIDSQTKLLLEEGRCVRVDLSRVPRACISVSEPHFGALPDLIQ